METSVIFHRSDKNNNAVCAIAIFRCDKPLTPSDILDEFEKAITKWINTTKEGQEAWDYSSEDFNIGDYAGYESDEGLQRCLSEAGIYVSIQAITSDVLQVSYDRVLVNRSDIKEDLE